MNNYREKLYEIRRLNMTYGHERDVEKLLDELLGDENLLLVDKRTLPIKFTKNINHVDNLPTRSPFTMVTYDARFDLIARHVEDGFMMDHFADIKGEVENYYLDDLEHKIYHELENGEPKEIKKEFEVHEFMNWKKIE